MCPGRIVLAASRFRLPLWVHRHHHFPQVCRCRLPLQSGRSRYRRLVNHCLYHPAWCHFHLLRGDSHPHCPLALGHALTLRTGGLHPLHLEVHHCLLLQADCQLLIHQPRDHRLHHLAWCLHPLHPWGDQDRFHRSAHLHRFHRERRHPHCLRTPNRYRLRPRSDHLLHPHTQCLCRRLPWSDRRQLLHRSDRVLRPLRRRLHLHQQQWCHYRHLPTVCCLLHYHRSGHFRHHLRPHQHRIQGWRCCFLLSVLRLEDHSLLRWNLQSEHHHPHHHRSHRLRLRPAPCRYLCHSRSDHLLYHPTDDRHPHCHWCDRHPDHPQPCHLSCHQRWCHLQARHRSDHDLHLPSACLDRHLPGSCRHRHHHWSGRLLHRRRGDPYPLLQRGCHRLHHLAVHLRLNDQPGNHFQHLPAVDHQLSHQPTNLILPHHSVRGGYWSQSHPRNHYLHHYLLWSRWYQKILLIVHLDLVHSYLIHPAEWRLRRCRSDLDFSDPLSHRYSTEVLNLHLVHLHNMVVVVHLLRCRAWTIQIPEFYRVQTSSWRTRGQASHQFLPAMPLLRRHQRLPAGCMRSCRTVPGIEHDHRHWDHSALSPDLRWLQHLHKFRGVRWKRWRHRRLPCGFLHQPLHIEVHSATVRSQVLLLIHRIRLPTSSAHLFQSIPQAQLSHNRGWLVGCMVLTLLQHSGWLSEVNRLVWTCRSPNLLWSLVFAAGSGRVHSDCRDLIPSSNPWALKLYIRNQGTGMLQQFCQYLVFVIWFFQPVRYLDWWLQEHRRSRSTLTPAPHWQHPALFYVLKLQFLLHIWN